MAGHTPLLSLTQLLILPRWLLCRERKKKDIFELITADSSPEGLVNGLLGGVDTHTLFFFSFFLGAVTTALGMDFAAEFRVRMISLIGFTFSSYLLLFSLHTVSNTPRRKTSHGIFKFFFKQSRESLATRKLQQLNREEKG